MEEQTNKLENSIGITILNNKELLKYHHPCFQVVRAIAKKKNHDFGIKIQWSMTLNWRNIHANTYGSSLFDKEARNRDKKIFINKGASQY